ncbi:class I SAM-dependent methyltransferase [Rhodoferax sp.]|uniref:class I SAM-dependent methyltransferase n=1 Tax=Rhodoferax sp. TaxID=50421 RepID=UPI0027791ACC|nr:class I SAM-dependent methyltransferase [Rhodoferax sp.]
MSSKPLLAPSSQAHVYRREVLATANDSLSKIVTRIPPGSTVLDVGTGSGALGRQLANVEGCVVDGITYNEEEAAIARPHYRKLTVMDLEQTALGEHFEAAQYDVIVCADVLEHLRNAAAVLHAIGRLLKPGGVVLVSLPNVTHLGVILGLMSGRFVRTQEGLLDATHVHFMDRTALQQLVTIAGYVVTQQDAVRRDLLETEFASLDLQMLPRGIRSFVLSLPDSDVYQFVWTLTPGPQGGAVGLDDGLTQAPPPAIPTIRQTPRFRTQLFLDRGKGYSEADGIEAFGVQSEALQTLVYPIEHGAEVLSVRLDFSDRPGQMEFVSLVARGVEGEICWSWSGDWASTHTYHQSDWTGVRGWLGGRMVRAIGTDPWVRLVLQPGQWAGVTQVELCVSSPQPLGSTDWPGLNVPQLQDVLAQTLARLEELKIQADTIQQVRDEVTRAQAMADDRQRTIDSMQSALTAAQQLAALRLAQIDALLASNSWRATAGLRWLSRLLSRGASR